jgi:hypothetical protein
LDIDEGHGVAYELCWCRIGIFMPHDSQELFQIPRQLIFILEKIFVDPQLSK